MAEFIADCTSLGHISIPFHARIIPFLILKSNRFDAEKVRYSNIAPRFQCRVIQKPFIHRGFSALFLTDARTRARAGALALVFAHLLSPAL